MESLGLKVLNESKYHERAQNTLLYIAPKLI